MELSNFELSEAVLFKAQMDAVVFPDFAIKLCKAQQFFIQEVRDAIAKHALSPSVIKAIYKLASESASPIIPNDLLVLSLCQWRAEGVEPPWITVVEPSLVEELSAFSKHYQPPNKLNKLKERKNTRITSYAVALTGDHLWIEDFVEQHTTEEQCTN